MNTNDFFQSYFNYVGESESPKIYHRWTAISMVAALLGRSIYFPFGHSPIFPNFYILLVGNPGTRKSSALTPARTALKYAKYKKFSPDRMSPERFIAELQKLNTIEVGELDEEQFDNLSVDIPNEMFVCASEFGDFIRKGNLDFLDLLTTLWDNLPEYHHPKLHGKSVDVNKPTLNILGGTTPQSLILNIPVEAIGQGLMSRFILVHGESSGKKIPFPTPITEEKIEDFASELIEIHGMCQGEMTRTKEASEVLSIIYENFHDIDDYRFKHYSTRRFTHLLKVTMILAAMRRSLVISVTDVLNANTLLNATEQRMPKALGEFGKAKHSDVANNILELLRSTKLPMDQKDLWKHVNQDLNKMQELVDILKNLMSAGKIRQMELRNKRGFLPVNKIINGWDKELIVQGFLTAEEEI